MLFRKIAYPMLFASVLFFSIATPAIAQFQRLYGDNQNNYFNKVIRDGNEFYVLGGDDGHATVSRINHAGTLLWTRKFAAPSVLTDGALIPNSNGQLMVVGFTLPFTSANQSLLGTVSPNGSLALVKTYNVGDNEGFTFIAPNPNGTMSAVGYLNSPGRANDVILLNVAANGAINNGYLYGNTGDNGFYNDIEVLAPGGDILMAGYDGSAAVMFQLDNSLSFKNSIREPALSAFTSVASAGSDLLLAGDPLPAGGAPGLIRLDANLFPKWSVYVVGLNTLSQVAVNSAGAIYAVGTGSFNGINRAVILKINDGGGTSTPVLTWARYYAYNETSYSGGSIAVLPHDDIAYVDGRTGHPNSPGMSDGFMAFSGPDLLQYCVRDTFVALVPYTPFPESVDLDFMDTTLPTETGGADGLDEKWTVRWACNAPKVIFDGLTYETQDDVNLELSGDSMVISTLGASTDPFTVQTDLTGALSYDLWYSFASMPGASVTHAYFGESPDGTEQLLGSCALRQITADTFESEIIAAGQASLQIEAFLDDTSVYKNVVSNGDLTKYIVDGDKIKWDRHLLYVHQPGDRPDLVFIVYEVTADKKIALVTPTGNIACNAVTFSPLNQALDTISLTRAEATVSGLPELVFHRAITLTSDNLLAICPGDSVTMTCTTLDGAGFQWQKDLATIPGAGSASLLTKETGKYRVQVSTPGGIYTSSMLPVTVLSEMECESSGTKGASGPQAINLHIFPNPNTGAFTVELPQPASPGMAFRIIDITGRLALEAITEAGSVRQTVLAGSLPNGLYFLQVLEEGKVLAMEKFVKQ